MRRMMQALAMLALATSVFALGSKPSLAAFGTKTITIVHMHSGESATITFARGGRYDQQALDQLNWLLRDWRTDEPTKMDPRLFDLLYEVYEQSGSRQPIQVVSAYRSPKTNAMLRRRSKMVAEHSQHMLGKAMDFYLSDVAPEKIRALAMRMQDGGVGYYPNANTPFIHLDVGGVRAWPRMTRAQLNNLFPDGKTVHIPADGRPLARYEEAKEEILARGGKVSGETYAEADGSERSGKTKSFWATLFGSRDEEEDESIPAPRRRITASRSVSRPIVSEDTDNNDKDRPVSFFTQRQNQAPVPEAPLPERQRVAIVPETQAPRPILPTVMAPLPPIREISTVAASNTSSQLVWNKGAQPQRLTDKENPFVRASTGAQISFASTDLQKSATEGIGQSVMTYAPLPPSRPENMLAGASKYGDLVDAPLTTSSIPKVPLPPERPSGLTTKTIALHNTPAKASLKPTAATLTKPNGQKLKEKSAKGDRSVKTAGA